MLAGKDEKLVTVRLYVCPAPGFFKPSRLYPSKNNVRTAWFLEQGSPGEGRVEACRVVLWLGVHWDTQTAQRELGVSD